MNKILSLFKIDIDPNRIFGLDILRALAIMFVVISHGAYLLPKKLKAISDFFTFDGVSIFFVLSGFLIGGILIRIIEKNGFNIHILKDFWIRRWFRTLPNYFLILITLCLLHLSFDEGFALSGVNRFFIFSQNLFTAHPAWFFPEAWSLSIEEWFYLLYPLLILFMYTINKSFQKSIFYSAVIVLFLITSFRYYRFSTTTITTASEWDAFFRKQVATRLDSLMFGVIGAYVYYYYETFWRKYKTQWLITGVFLFLMMKFIFPIFFNPIGMYACVFSFTLISLATLFLLPYLSNLKTGKGFLYKPVTYISLISYSMYLLNLSIVQKWILNKIPWGKFTDNGYAIIISKYSCYWILVIGLSILIYKYFEIPMTALREKMK